MWGMQQWREKSKLDLKHEGFICNLPTLVLVELLGFCVTSIRTHLVIGQGPRMLHADIQQKASPCSRVSHATTILTEQEPENTKNFYFQESQFKKEKNTHLQACAKCTVSAQALLSMFILSLLTVV